MSLDDQQMKRMKLIKETAEDAKERKKYSCSSCYPLATKKRNSLLKHKLIINF